MGYDRTPYEVLHKLHYGNNADYCKTSIEIRQRYGKDVTLIGTAAVAYDDYEEFLIMAPVGQFKPIALHNLARPDIYVFENEYLFKPRH